MEKYHKFNINVVARFSIITNHINEVQGTIELFLKARKPQLEKYNALIK